MQVIGLGTDIVEVKRIEALAQKAGRLIPPVYTERN